MSKPANRPTTKPAKERSRKAAAERSIAAQPSVPEKTTTSNDRKEKDGQSSKQARVVEMLNSPTGTTIAAVMKATGWQQHSVRGFFAGIVRKKFGLKLTSKKTDGERIYRVPVAKPSKSKPNSKIPAQPTA